MNTPTSNGFDRIAWIYDRVARLVYGRAIVESQCHFLDQIPSEGRVLVIGGGTGWILHEIFKKCPNCKVCYIEASAKMIARAQQKGRIYGDRVTYINGTQDDTPNGEGFDVLITNFFLDVFPEKELPAIINQLPKSLNSFGFWVFTDFRNTKILWQKWLIRVMYLFFRQVCGLRSKELPDWHRVFQEAGYIPQSDKTYFYGMIIAAKMVPIRNMH